MAPDAAIGQATGHRPQISMRQGCSKKLQPNSEGHTKSSRLCEEEEEDKPPQEEPGHQGLKRSRQKAGLSTKGGRRTKRQRRATFEESYMEQHFLGEGGFGSVFAGIRIEDQMPVAIKYISKDRAEETLEIPGQGTLPLEVALMSMVNAAPHCSNILRLLEWFEQPSQFVLILELLEPCQDLAEFCEAQGGSLDENVTREVMKQLLRALRHCEKRGVLHRDVKPENVLILTDSHTVKLIDFGCGDLLQDCPYDYFAGTFQYAPPEWFLHSEYMAGPATVWSVGVTMFRLVCGFAPFTSSRQIIQSHLPFPQGPSAEFQDLIRWCLKENPEDRPTLKQMRRHRWSEAHVRRLQKERDELEQRLTDLRKAWSFLSDLTKLHRSYLQHCNTHPDEEPVYGPSCMPALLLEARGTLGAEHQPKTVHEKLQQSVDQADNK
ncbi:serine/threonine-protein kinase pim-1-like [Chanos chanos]|uniref:non-specific serine/threonine protein kinase n=1 Tax=Chanos chanos TaxID=29144 RepID=A0A6J2UQL5_CHACN|nr:serine/threonine-protein kinase pim-1-like [Chanos chanos]